MVVKDQELNKERSNESNEDARNEFLADAAFAANHSPEPLMKASFQRDSKAWFLLIATAHSGGDALRGHTRSHPEHDG